MCVLCRDFPRSVFDWGISPIDLGEDVTDSSMENIIKSNLSSVDVVRNYGTIHRVSFMLTHFSL